MRSLRFTTSRRDGDARRPGRLPKLLKRRGLSSAVATAEQVHGVKVVVVPPLAKPKRYPKTDGLLTAAPQQPLAIFTADCVPAFLEVPKRGVIGVLHAGWRGVYGKILQRAVRILTRRWGVRPHEIEVQ